MLKLLSFAVASVLAVFMLFSTTVGVAHYHFDPFTDQRSPIYGQDRKEFEAKWAQKCEHVGHKQDSEAFRRCMAQQEDRLRNLFRPRGAGR